MKDSFIGKNEINDFLNTIDDNKDSSLFRVCDNDHKGSSNKHTQITNSSKEEKKFEETPYRFVVVFLFCILSLSNGMQWVTFAPIADKFQKVYGMSRFLVDLFSMSYMIVYPFINFPCSYIIDNKSMRAGISISAVLTIVGAACKIFINKSMFFPYLGQTLAAIAQPFILNSPGKFASTWFREERRVLVTSICCISNTLGIVFGYICPTFFLDNKMGDQEFKNQIENYLFAETLISACLCLPVLIFMRSKPDKPPSNSQSHYESPPLKECLKMMLKNKSFLKLLISFTCILGYFNVYGTIINEYFSMYGLDEDQTSYVAGIANILAIISCLITSIILDKFKNYKKAFIILNIVGLISQIAMTVLLEILEENRFLVFTIFWSLCSLSILPIYTLSMDFVCELTYPVGESISGGFIMSFTQISGIIGILFTDYLMENFSEYKYLPNTFCLIFFIVSFLGIFSLEEKLLRQEKDHEVS